MKTLKLILGILSIVLAAMVLFQSCAAGVANTLSDNGESGGTGGFALALGMIAGGIIMIATRASGKKGGSIAALILYALAALIGFVSAGSYADLNIWAGLCAVLAVINFIAMLLIKRGADKSKGEQKE